MFYCILLSVLIGLTIAGNSENLIRVQGLENVHDHVNAFIRTYYSISGPLQQLEANQNYIDYTNFRKVISNLYGNVEEAARNKLKLKIEPEFSGIKQNWTDLAEIVLQLCTQLADQDMAGWESYNPELADQKKKIVTDAVTTAISGINTDDTMPSEFKFSNFPLFNTFNHINSRFGGNEYYFQLNSGSLPSPS